MTSRLRRRLSAMTGIAVALVLTVGAGAQIDGRAQARSPDGRDRAVRVHNETGVVIASISVSRAGSRAATATPRIGVPLAPGETATMIVDDGSGACVYDFQARLQDGTVVSRRDVNVCEEYDLYYTR